MSNALMSFDCFLGGLNLKVPNPTTELFLSIDLKNKGEDVNKNIKAAKAANLYKQRSSIADPTIRGETPVGKAVIDGVELPSLRGRNYGPPGAGGTEYAHKPKGQFGKYFI